MTKYLTLCVNALSYSIKPKVTYYLIGNEHLLNSEAITNIHLDQVCIHYYKTVTKNAIKCIRNFYFTYFLFKKNILLF